MRVALLGSQTLNIREEDIFRYAKNVVYPHTPDTIVTTNDDGVAASARRIARDKNLGLVTYDNYRDVIGDCDSVVILRANTEHPAYAKYCAYKGRPFREYVVTTK